MLHPGIAFCAMGSFATICASTASAAPVVGSALMASALALCSSIKDFTASSCSSRNSLRTTVTPVTMLLPLTPCILFHSSFKSKITFSASFCMQAAVTKGWGNSPMAVGSSASTDATSVASDLYSSVTSSTDMPLAFSRYCNT